MRERASTAVHYECETFIALFVNSISPNSKLSLLLLYLVQVKSMELSPTLSISTGTIMKMMVIAAEKWRQTNHTCVYSDLVFWGRVLNFIVLQNL